MAESRQNIMEKAESRFLETQKKTADRAKATVEYQTEAKAESPEDGQTAGAAACQGRGRARRRGIEARRTKEETGVAPIAASSLGLIGLPKRRSGLG